jgi:hypothetical protein
MVEWEKISSTGLFPSNGDVVIEVLRAKVSEGWLVMVVDRSANPRPVGVTFVPDPSHSWDSGLFP